MERSKREEGGGECVYLGTGLLLSLSPSVFHPAYVPQTS